jgi:DeoR/GlpR family transcriptional regulator of sugar metabolism
VTGATIRSDLKTLAEEGRLIRVHGGAMLPPSRLEPVQPLAVRLERRQAEKHRIAREAAREVEDGDIVAIDASSTTLALARMLKERRDLTVLTNSLAVAQVFLDTPGHKVLITGGALRHETASIVGPETVAFIARYRVRTLFLSAHAADVLRGLCEIDAQEIEVKHAMMSIAERSIALMDSSKWSRTPMLPFVAFDALYALITDDGIGEEALRALGRQRVTVHVAHAT